MFDPASGRIGGFTISELFKVATALPIPKSRNFRSILSAIC
jgi:hypothetical protein